MSNLNSIVTVAGLITLIGLTGLFLRKNLVIMLMCLELMLLGGVIALIGGARNQAPQSIDGHVPDGALFVPFILIIAACEVCIGLTLVLKIFKAQKTLWVDEIDEGGKEDKT
jgi:NADH-quinone oxidoreductase subunit K